MTVKSCEKVEKSQVALTIEVNAAEFEAAVEKAYQKMRRKISVPGFRPGKAPRKMIERMYGAEVFFEEAINIAFPEAYEAAVEQEKLDLILEAGRNAPTAHNKQPQRIFVFRSPEALEKADACMDCHFHAPVVIGVGYDPKESWHREHDGKDHGEIDASIAVTQMMLQAADLGLGTTYVGMFRPVDLIKTFPEMEGLEMIAMLPLGYPAEGAHPAKLHGLRKPMEELVKYL